jgi:tRNA (guanine10-N2)-methyltransferase
MDPHLALIMANMAHVRPNDFVYDPFVGTGGLLVGAAHLGAHVSGADLDFNMMHARGLSSRMGQKYRSKSETIPANLKQYKLDQFYVDVLIADFSTKYMREDFKVDAIVTDPPYGIREKTKKLGNRKKARDDEQSADDDNKCASEDDASGDESSENLTNEPAAENETNAQLNVDKNGNNIVNRIPQHTKYMLGEIFHDLLRFAAKHLEVNARLVFWLPVHFEKDRSTMT